MVINMGNQIIQAWQDKQTPVCNCFRLRELHVEMEKTVKYRWDDLELGLEFHETAQGLRFTVSESARWEILSRLLKLKYEKWKEELNSEESVMRLKAVKKSKGGKVRKSKSINENAQRLFE